MSLKKILFLIVIVVILAVIGLVAIPFTKRESSKPLQQDQHVFSGQVNSVGAYVHNEEGTFYKISVDVPEKTSLSNIEADQKARLTMETEMQKLIDQFKTDTDAENINLKDSPWMEGRKVELGATYKPYTSAHFVSYEFDVYEDTGGAHPNGYFGTFVFDADGNQIALGSLYKPGTNYLAALSTEVTAQVTAEMKKRLEVSDLKDMVFTEGLTPKEENFSNFVINGNNLLILIPPYQVAAYAVGTFDIPIPLYPDNKTLAPNVP